MQTYSHFLVTAVAADRLKNHDIPVHPKPLLWGSVLPDIPLGVLSLAYLAYYRWVAPLPDGVSMIEQYDVLYFTDPVWKVGHNFFHAPLIILALLGLGVFLGRRGTRWGWGVAWFALGCGIHSFIDVFTHYSDGPLLLFPLNWDWRFNSPVSYWDVDHYGGIFAPLEHLVDLAILLYFGRTWLRNRRAARMVSAQT